MKSCLTISCLIWQQVKINCDCSCGFYFSSRNYYPHPIPQSPFHPDFTILWDFNISRFLQRPDVQGQPYKIITWIVKKPYVPSLPEPVRLRTCPEMPCLMTTNTSYQNKSAALLWAGQKISDETPPKRSNLDQVTPLVFNLLIC